MPETIGVISNCYPEHLRNSAIASLEDARLGFDLVGGNSGNLVFAEACTKLIGSLTIEMSWDMPIEQVRTSIDRIVVCCANQLGSHIDLAFWNERIKLFNKPVSLIGLGAQCSSYDEIPRIPRGTFDFLRTVSALSTSGGVNISTRGRFTSSILANLGLKSTPTGCPSVLMSSGSEIERNIRIKFKNDAPHRIAVTAGSPWIAGSSPVEQTLISLIKDRTGAYIVQAPVELMAMTVQAHAALGDSERNHVLTWLGLGHDAVSAPEWFQKNGRLFFDVTQWMEHLTHFDLVIGTRFHGACLAIQAGVMATVITIDSRTRELCETAGIKNMPLAKALLMNRDQLRDAATWREDDLQCFLDRQQQSAAMLSTFFKNNRIEPSPHARGLPGWVS